MPTKKTARKKATNSKGKNRIAGLPEKTEKEKKPEREPLVTPDDFRVKQVIRDPAQVRLLIEGVPPGLIMQSKGLMDYYEKHGGGPGKRGMKLSHEKEAELHAHWVGRGKSKSVAIPSVMFYRSFTQGATAFKDIIDKKSTWKRRLSATIAFEHDLIAIDNKYEVYTDWVRIPPGPRGAFVQVGRPRFKTWKVETIMLVDDELYNVYQLADIIVHAGKMVGIGANSPRQSNPGPYGKYLLKEFEVLNR